MKITKIVAAGIVASVAASSAFAAPTSVYDAVEMAIGTAYAALDVTALDTNTQTAFDNLIASVDQHGRVSATTDPTIVIGADTTTLGFTASNVTVYDNSRAIHGLTLDLVEAINVDLYGTNTTRNLNAYSLTTIAAAPEGIVGAQVNLILQNVATVMSDIDDIEAEARSLSFDGVLDFTALDDNVDILEAEVGQFNVGVDGVETEITGVNLVDSIEVFDFADNAPVSRVDSAGDSSVTNFDLP